MDGSMQTVDGKMTSLVGSQKATDSLSGNEGTKVRKS